MIPAENPRRPDPLIFLSATHKNKNRFDIRTYAYHLARMTSRRRGLESDPRICLLAGVRLG
jgi:hypothetical protein